MKGKGSADGERPEMGGSSRGGNRKRKSGGGGEKAVKREGVAEGERYEERQKVEQRLINIGR